MPTRAVALVLIALFGYQISRIYLVTKVDAFFVCPNTEVWTSSSTEMNEASSSRSATAPQQRQLVLESIVAPTDDGSNSIRSCKGTFAGLGLSPLQPSCLPGHGALLSLAIHWVRVSGESERGPEIEFPPLCQPPRSLS